VNNQHDHETKVVLKGTLILTISALVIKILSAVYRIPFQNIVGDTGFYIYQQVYPLYGIMVVLGAYGFPAAVSKMIADAEGELQARRKILAAALFWTGLFAVTLFVILFFGAEKIALFMNDVQLTLPIKAVSFSFLVIPISAVIRGYFQGKSNMFPTAVSQTTEQFVRVGVILLLSTWLFHSGSDLYTIGAGAMFGALAGGLASVTLLFVFAKKTTHSLALQKPSQAMLQTVGKALLFQGLAFCLTNLLLVLLQLIDSFQLYKNLVMSGFAADQAKMIKGVFDRGQPLLQLGVVISTSLGLSVIPMLAKLVKVNKKQEIFEKIKMTMRLSFGFGLGAAVGLILLIKPINIMLFTNADGTNTLRILMITVFFASIFIACATILQILGKVRLNMLVIAFILLVKLSLNQPLISEYGILGAALATVIAVSSGSMMIYVMLCYTIQKSPISIKKALSLLLSISIMAVTLILIQLLPWQVNSRWHAAMTATLSSVIGGIVYLIALFKFRFFTKAELSFIPFAHKLQFLFKIRS